MEAIFSDQVLQMLVDFIWPYIEANKSAAAIGAALLLIQSVMKPIMSAIEAYVKWTKSPEDDLAFERAKGSKALGIFNWFLDYTLRVKVKVIGDLFKKDEIGEIVQLPIGNQSLDEKKSP